MATLKYMTLGQLMSSVESDLSTYADNGMIDRGKLVKVIRRVNEDIGLKIYREREEVIDICNYKGDLPEDFYQLELALVCQADNYYLAPGSVPGTHTEEHKEPVTTCAKQGACLNECGGCYWVTQNFKDKVIKYTELKPIRVTKKSQSFCSDKCINNRIQTATYDLDIDNGEVVTGFREGKLYISYLADMVNEDGELLLLDHPLVIDYYEYAVKKMLLENWVINKQADVAQQLGYIKNELREARIRAINFTGTIEYSEIQGVFQANRTRFYNQYHRMFDDGY